MLVQHLSPRFPRKDTGTRVEESRASDLAGWAYSARGCGRGSSPGPGAEGIWVTGPPACTAISFSVRRLCASVPGAMPSCQATKFFQISRPRGLWAYSSQLGNAVRNRVSTVALNWKARPVWFGSLLVQGFRLVC